MSAGLQVPLQPPLARVLAQDLHHPAGWGEVGVVRRHRVDRPGVGAVGGREDRAEKVRGGLVGADDTEVPLVLATP